MTERDDDAWLDRMLDAAPEVTPSAALRRAVAEIPLRHLHAAHGALTTSHAPRFALRAVLTGALLATLAGALVGSYSEELAAGSVTALASEDAEAEEPWEDLTLLAFAAELDAELEP